MVWRCLLAVATVCCLGSLLCCLKVWYQELYALVEVGILGWSCVLRSSAISRQGCENAGTGYYRLQGSRVRLHGNSGSYFTSRAPSFVPLLFSAVRATFPLSRTTQHTHSRPQPKNTIHPHSRPNTHRPCHLPLGDLWGPHSRLNLGASRAALHFLSWWRS